MLLRDDLRYVVLDFETTGTDKKYDEIIQIGIIEFDVHGQKVREFSSYIKPERTEKLHDIVDMITGISIDTVLAAPTRDEIKPTVDEYFTDKTVVIGHSVHFDLAFLNRYGIDTYFTSIDTLTLTQMCRPYLQSYALEIVAQALLQGNGHTKAAYHDALVDSDITGQIFFMMVGSISHIFHTYPYLREITKRTSEGFPLCMNHNSDARFLLQDIPTLGSTVLANRTSLSPDEQRTPGRRYIGDVFFDTLIGKTTTQGVISGFAQHQKVLLAQKRLAQQGTMLHIHEPQIFDIDLLHAFLTKKEFTEAERRFALKYYFHCNNNHKSFHAVNSNEHKLLKALLISNPQQSTKKLYTHAEIFTQVSTLSLNPGTHIVLYDKERLLDSWKKRRFQSVDLYHVADSIEAIIYSYTLQGKDTSLLQDFLATWYIFVGEFTHETTQHCKDTNSEKVQVDNYNASSYFYKSQKIIDHIPTTLKQLNTQIHPVDFATIEKKVEKILQLLSAPVILQTKWADYNQRIQLQPVDTFTSRDDIERLFEGYTVSYFSALDKTFPALPFTVPVTTKQIIKRKDIVVGPSPKVCIIAPSKAAAQQLVTSLHKSKVYGECFLAAEHVTGGAGKIIQQTLQKKSYILIGGYGFCLQCIAHGIEFDTISALDIMNQGHINPFMDLSYYAATKQIS